MKNYYILQSDYDPKYRREVKKFIKVDNAKPIVIIPDIETFYQVDKVSSSTYWSITEASTGMSLVYKHRGRLKDAIAKVKERMENIPDGKSIYDLIQKARDTYGTFDNPIINKEYEKIPLLYEKFEKLTGISLDDYTSRIWGLDILRLEYKLDTLLIIGKIKKDNMSVKDKLIMIYSQEVSDIIQKLLNIK